jgi:hypothetical protein
MADLDELLQDATKLHQQLHGIQIRGPGWSGDARKGFIFNAGPSATEGGEGSGGGAPPTPVGACCIDEDCSILTEAACIAAGGDFQGVGTGCDPNPCVVVCDDAIGRDIQVEFSDIVVDCGCQTVTGTNEIVADLLVNTTYILPWPAWTDYNSQTITHDQYFSAADCSGSPFSEGNRMNGLEVACVDGLWHVRYYNSASINNLLFFADSAPSAPISNQLTVCGPYPAAGASAVALGHGGTCRITIL